MLGLLGDTDFAGGISIEQHIKDFYSTVPGINPGLLAYAMTQPLQKWDVDRERYEYTGVWNTIVGLAGGGYKKFAGTQKLFNKYVRLIADAGDTQGWKLRVDKSDLTPTTPQYLTEAFNLSVKAKPSQWLRWWGNSITPFSSLQCVIGKITNEGRPHDLAQLQNQQDASVVYYYPSANISTSKYITASSVAFSRIGQIKPNTPKGPIGYDILFKLVDPQGDVIASFQVDPEIIVI